MKLYIQAASLMLLFFLNANSSSAQISAGGQPYSYTHQARLSEPIAQQVPSLSMNKVRQQDEEHPGNSRFAAPVAVNYTLEDSGNWTNLPDGSRLWRLKLNAPNALGIAAFYDDFHLPAGAQLFMYSPDYQQIKGAYTEVNNTNGERFVTGFIKGQTAIIEYYEPAGQIGQGRFHISRIDQVYHKENFETAESSPGRMPFGYGTAEDCHQNANCPESDGWEAQKRSVCRIVMTLEEGTGYCTGTLVNNTSEDETPYVLSAYHCQDGYTPIYGLWRYDFDYQSANCDDPAVEPVPNSILGCELRASRLESDFLLLELSSDIPPAYDVVFAGWNRAETPPQSGVNFHHPSGDIKKVSLYNQPAVIHPNAINWDTDVTTPANHHFRLNYSVGSYEPGSSGSALFNSSGQVVGQLHGGFNGECQGIPTVYFGRFSVSWDAGDSPDTRLRDWLDPTGLDLDSLGHSEQSAPAQITIQGTVANESGTPIENAQVVFSGSITDTTYTDQSGFYSQPGVPTGMPVGLAINKGGVAQNGCSALDLIKIARHNLGLEPLGSPYKMMGADTNGSGSITPLDQIAIRKVILGIETSFPGKPIWQFWPATFPFTDPTDPFADFIPAVFTITNFSSNITVDFVGIKTGDMDDSGDTD